MPTTPTSLLKRIAGVLLLTASCAPLAFGQISFNGTIYTETFNSLGLVTSNAVFTGTVGSQTAIPNLTNWAATKVAGSSLGNSTINFTADTGSGNSGAVYNYGSSNSTDRALGLLASGTNAFAIGTAFTNTSGQTITSITIRYTGEYWRSSTAQQNTLTFAYGITSGSSATTATLSNYLTNNTLLPLAGLDLVGPGPVSSNGPLNGNVVPNRKKFSLLIDNISWAPNATLFIRWTDIDNGGNDAGLAVDDFSIVQGVYTDPDDVPIGILNTNFTPSLFGGDPFGATKNAVFDKTGTSVGLAGSVIAKALKFNTSGYTLTSPTSADSIALSTGEVFVASSISATISGNLTGNGGLEKTGLGTLLLTGPKSFSGNVTISEGRLEISDDSALGSASNGITFGGTLATSGNFTFGAGRTISGFGTLESFTGGNLTFGGPLSNASLTITGPSSVAINAATNTIGTLTFSQPVSLTIAAGNMTVSSGLTFSQSSGNSTISGGLNFGAGGNTIALANGNLTPFGTLTGNMTGTSRISKTGSGTLLMTSTTLTGPTGLRVGLQGGFPEDGGKVVVDQPSDLGTLQTLFNSGTIEATSALTFPVGLSIGGRLNSNVPIATLAGGNMTFTGNSSFFNASGAGGTGIGLNVTNNTVFSGNFTATSPATVATPIPTAFLVNLTGNGTLTYSGNASAVLDNLYLTGSLNLVIGSTGILGGEALNADSGTTVSGAGIFSGYRVFPSGSGNTTIAETYKPSSANLLSGSTLSPTGVLRFRSNLTLESGSYTILDINSSVLGSGYDSVDVSVPSGQTTITTYALTTNGYLTLNVAAPASSGNYTLFTTGPGVSRFGNFNSITLAGGYTGTLSGNATTTSGNKTFSFEQSTGVLTIGNVVTAPAVTVWRDTNFPPAGSSNSTTGPGADAADFDGDGVSNLLEYVAGTNPTVATANPVVSSSTTLGADTVLTLTYPRHPTDTSLTYTVLGSNDLTTAFGATSGNTTISGNNATYTDNVPLNATNPRRFLRLQVGNPAP